MRSLHNTQPNLTLMNMMNNNRGVSSLASQFMDMFDASKLDTSLLKKRELQTQDNLYQIQLQKKIKTTDLTMPSPLQLTGMNPLLYNLSSQFNPLLATLGGDQTFGLQAVTQLQNLALLKQQKEALLGLQPLSFPNLGNSLQMKVQQLAKQDYIKQEELPTSQGSPSSNPFKSTLSDKHTTNEDSPVTSELETSNVEMTEPALVDFTKEFPDWDLATIFSYIKSGKSREVFEKEKQYKIERKIRRKKLRMASKEKTGQQGKTVRGKRMTGKTQETH